MTTLGLYLKKKEFHYESKGQIHYPESIHHFYKKLNKTPQFSKKY
jgi:hypothetical protein